MPTYSSPGGSVKMGAEPEHWFALQLRQGGVGTQRSAGYVQFSILAQRGPIEFSAANEEGSFWGQASLPPEKFRTSPGPLGPQVF